MEKSSFFNSVNGDRRYKATDFAEYFSSFIGNGVFPNPSTNLQVIANNNMTVALKAGRGWINGYIYTNTNDLILNIDPADGVLNRIDRVVLRLDFVKREIRAVIKKGDVATNAVVKTLQRDADCYELALADIVVNKGTISITQSNILDLRLNKDLCGVVKGTIEEIDVTTLFNQYNAKLGEKSIELEKQFYDWFKTIQTHLEGDIAANLAIKVAKLEGDLGKEELNTNKKEIKGAINEIKSSIDNLKVPVTKVNGKDGEIILSANDIKNSEGKTVETKLTELFQSANNSLTQVNNGKTTIAGAVGGVTGQSSFQDIANYITYKRNEIGGYLGAGDYATMQRLCDWTTQRKTDLANQLVAKGVGANNQENLGQLISKISQINTGYKVSFGNGSFNFSAGTSAMTRVTVNNLGFKPQILVISILRPNKILLNNGESTSINLTISDNPNFRSDNVLINATSTSLVAIVPCSGTWSKPDGFDVNIKLTSNYMFPQSSGDFTWMAISI